MNKEIKQVEIYILIKMSEKWHALRAESILEAEAVITAHIEQGTIVMICDDLESFCDEMKMSLQDIDVSDLE